MINPYLYQNIGYDPQRDFLPVGLASEVPYLLVAGRHLGVRDLAGLVALAKTRSLTYGSSGNGSTAHLMMALFAEATGGRYEHVPYRGSAQSITDLLAGRIDVLFDTGASLLPHWREGTLVALASGNNGPRPAIAREIPTLAEAGYPRAAASGWHCMIAPAGLPETIAARLQDAFRTSLTDPEFRERLSSLGVEPPDDGSAAALARRIRAEAAQWREAIRISGASID